MSNFHCAAVEALHACAYGCVMEANDQSTKTCNRIAKRKGSFWARAVIGVIAIVLASFLFLRPAPVQIAPEEQAQLLALAREQLIASAAGEDLIPLEPDDVTERTQRQGAAFVSLTAGTELRGCMIDRFEPHEPLFVNVLHNVQLAVGADDRFAAITEDEIDDVRIKVSIVHKIKDVSFKTPNDLVDKLTPFVNGVILRIDEEIATYLPSIWEIFPDPAEFLSQLCIKAGWNSERWRTEPYPTIQTYCVYEFGEPE